MILLENNFQINLDDSIEHFFICYYTITSINFNIIINILIDILHFINLYRQYFPEIIQLSAKVADSWSRMALNPLNGRF